MALESKITGSILTYLRKQGCFAEKTHGGPNTRKGMPDIVACINGRYVGIEVKRPGKVASKAQEQCLKEITDAGGLGTVITSLDEVKTLHKWLMEKRHGV